MGESLNEWSSDPAVGGTGIPSGADTNQAAQPPEGAPPERGSRRERTIVIAACAATLALLFIVVIANRDVSTTSVTECAWSDADESILVPGGANEVVASGGPVEVVTSGGPVEVVTTDGPVGVHLADGSLVVERPQSSEDGAEQPDSVASRERCVIGLGDG